MSMTVDIPFSKRVDFLKGIDTEFCREDWSDFYKAMSDAVQVIAQEPRAARNAVLGFRHGHDSAGDSKLFASITSSFLQGGLPQMNPMMGVDFFFQRGGQPLLEKNTMYARASGLYEVTFGTPLAFWPLPLLGPRAGEKPISFWRTWTYDGPALSEEGHKKKFDLMYEEMGVIILGWQRIFDEKAKLTEKWLVSVGGDISFDMDAFVKKFCSGPHYKPRKMCTVCVGGTLNGEGHDSPNCPVLKRVSGSRVKAGYKKLVVQEAFPYLHIGWVTLELADIDVGAEIRTLQGRVEKLESRMANVEKSAPGKRKRDQAPTDAPPAKKPKGQGQGPNNQQGGSGGGKAQGQGGPKGKKGKGKGKAPGGQQGN
ncbi:hypothetical protein P691DRAFT_766636 [Macrolepiota fuliginosa MF-IS2]|uniref:Uncharacterized protein n=1 Tax=Macrolepiota fuliginosa MF-IS2 TaxID=1400762 RepID=A0A9P5X068_9AGAR|nr:hypothetical protein P691DRAFT_766636 [Macrolepiota fuliginosa MF-IS2]